MNHTYRTSGIFLVIVTIMLAVCVQAVHGDEEDTRNVLKQGLVGAGVGAISAGASGGDAGKGALIGAGTNVIGNALLDAITAPPSSSRSRRSAPPPDDDEYYYTEEPAEEYYEEPPQESGSSKVLKQGLVGAGVGAISAGASGGDAGKGALIGAGTNVIGNALLDTITQPSEQRRGKVYRRIPRQNQKQTVQSEDGSTTGERKKVIRKYDENGKVVSEEEIYY